MILIAYGCRPEFLKLLPLFRVLDNNNFQYKILFTGQQEDIGKFKYDYKLTIKDGQNRLDSIVLSLMDKLDWILDLNKNITHVLVQGDTTSAMTIALSAFHHELKVIHLEAGLRSYDRYNPYPEEINRRIISEIANIHLCPTEFNAQNLKNEYINQRNIYVVGNTVIDNLLQYKDKCEYTNKILVTLHRRENHNNMNRWFSEVNKLAESHPEYEFILPLHPNPNVQQHKMLLKHVNVIKPLPYDEMLNLLIKTRIVITDSGGIQEECSFFNKKCLVCRQITERPEAIGQSTVMVEKPDKLFYVFEEHHNIHEINYNCPFGDGHAAEKIYEILKELK